jgi:hypothetical protein
MLLFSPALAELLMDIALGIPMPSTAAFFKKLLRSAFLFFIWHSLWMEYLINSQ